MSEHDKTLARRQRWLGRVVLAGVAVVIVGLAGRLVHINTALASRLLTLAEEQQFRQRIIPARRGLIFDTQGRIVAGSKQVESVFADPALIEQPDETARAVATILGMDAGRIEDQIRNSSSPRFCWLKRRVSPAEANAIRDLDPAGIGLRAESQRTYPMGQLMAHVLGVVGLDGDGLEGLEREYDAHLRGQPGLRSTICDASRRAISGRTDRTFDPQDGGHLVLTLDAVIQQIAEEQLARQVEEFEAESGVAVVMDPATGEVLAMACQPTFDPNEFGAVPPEARRNRAVTDPVEPGSTFKPIVASAAVLHRVVALDEKIYCHRGLYKVGARLLRDTHPRGELTLEEIVTYSSNIGMGIVGMRLGNERMHQIVRAFGLGEPTNVGFPGEDPGLVMPLSRWTTYSTTSVPMGYEVLVTPLQLASAFCAIVNDGVLLRPRLVRARLSAEGDVVESFDTPVVVRRAIPAEVARYIAQKVMVNVVENGTGKPCRLSEYQVLGKSGTAKLAYRGRRGYEPGAYLGSFVAAAPAENPRVLALVMIRRPNAGRGYYGSKVAAPAVREILRASLPYRGVPGREWVAAGM